MAEAQTHPGSISRGYTLGIPTVVLILAIIVYGAGFALLDSFLVVLMLLVVPIAIIAASWYMSAGIWKTIIQALAAMFFIIFMLSTLVMILIKLWTVYIPTVLMYISPAKLECQTEYERKDAALAEEMRLLLKFDRKQYDARTGEFARRSAILKEERDRCISAAAIFPPDTLPAPAKPTPPPLIRPPLPKSPAPLPGQPIIVPIPLPTIALGISAVMLLLISAAKGWDPGVLLGAVLIIAAIFLDALVWNGPLAPFIQSFQESIETQEFLKLRKF